MKLAHATCRRGPGTGPASVRPGRLAGFTLIELLVVVGIIGLLMAILLPTLTRARQEVMKIQCAANLREWSSALQMRAADYNNAFVVLSYERNPAPMHIDFSPGWLGDPDGPRAEAWQFFDDYLIFYDPRDTEDGANVVQYCPTKPLNDFRRGHTGANIGYGYLPNRHIGDQSGGGFIYEPNDGWVSKTRYDGPYAAAPIMFDLFTRDTASGETIDFRSAHLSSREIEALGSNFLYEDGSVHWENADNIYYGGIHAGFLDKFFRIDIQGILDDVDRTRNR